MLAKLGLQIVNWVYALKHQIIIINLSFQERFEGLVHKRDFHSLQVITKMHGASLLLLQYTWYIVFYEVLKMLENEAGWQFSEEEESIFGQSSVNGAQNLIFLRMCVYGRGGHMIWEQNHLPHYWFLNGPGLASIPHFRAIKNHMGEKHENNQLLDQYIWYCFC